MTKTNNPYVNYDAKEIAEALNQLTNLEAAVILTDFELEQSEAVFSFLNDKNDTFASLEKAKEATGEEKAVAHQKLEAQLAGPEMESRKLGRFLQHCSTAIALGQLKLIYQDSFERYEQVRAHFCIMEDLQSCNNRPLKLGALRYIKPAPSYKICFLAFSLSLTH